MTLTSLLIGTDNPQERWKSISATLVPMITLKQQDSECSQLSTVRSIGQVSSPSSDRASWTAIEAPPSSSRGMECKHLGATHEQARMNDR